MLIYSDIDECSSNPCPSDATCNNLVNNYTCSCTSGKYHDKGSNTCKTGECACLYAIFLEMYSVWFYQLSEVTGTSLESLSSSNSFDLLNSIDYASFTPLFQSSPEKNFQFTGVQTTKHWRDVILQNATSVKYPLVFHSLIVFLIAALL